MITFVKILGPPINKALKELEKVAINKPDVCMMSAPIKIHFPLELAKDVNEYTGYDETARYLDPKFPDFAWNYFKSSDIIVSRERCESIISKSGVKLGEYDFYFEWKIKPTSKDIEELVQEIDTALMPLGCLYTLVTK